MTEDGTVGASPRHGAKASVSPGEGPRSPHNISLTGLGPPRAYRDRAPKWRLAVGSAAPRSCLFLGRYVKAPVFVAGAQLGVDPEFGPQYTELIIDASHERPVRRPQ